MARRLLLCAVAIAFLAACGESGAPTGVGGAGSEPVSTPVTPATAADLPTAPGLVPSLPAGGSSTGCDANPMAHVYNPDRLAVLDPCLTVSGTIALIRTEADGDYHVLVKLDAGQLCDGADCLDDANRSDEQGDLVVEPVCEHTITQSDAVAACAGYQNSLVVPPVGTHTTVTGPWVLDKDHGWNEIHPVEHFNLTAAPAASPPAAAPQGTRLSVVITASRYGYVAARTAPGSVCSARAQLPSGRTSTAAGLQVQDTAGSDGAVSWTYRTSSSTLPGTGTHTVSCQLQGQTASASASFTVS